MEGDSAQSLLRLNFANFKTFGLKKTQSKCYTCILNPVIWSFWMKVLYDLALSSRYKL